MKLKLIEKIEQVVGVTSFIFQPQKEINWYAGQYMFYNLPHKNVDSEGDTRYFTISNAPFEKNIAITTRITKSSFKQALASLPIGAEIDADGPEGEFIVPDNRNNLVFIAGGIGITPFRAILLQMEHEKKMKNIELIYASRDIKIIFKDLLQEIAKKFPSLKIDYIIDPKIINEALLGRYLSPEKYFYVSGPKPMAEGISKTLAGMGVDRSKVIEDFFPGYKEY
jgi:ferredoxin-NADP reductase